MESIACWAHVDVGLGGLLANLLKLDAGIGIAMFFGLSGGETRRSALEAAARKALNSDDFALFARVSRAINSARDRRNNFAHGLWGVSDELPDALLWINPDDHLCTHQTSWFTVRAISNAI
jgi:hypothetical protein